jgi:hypothetical protein
METDRVPVAQQEILVFPLPIKHVFAFNSEFSTVRGSRKCTRSERFLCNLFKSQLRIVPSIVIELTDDFDLREGQSCADVGFLRFRGWHDESVPLAGPV